MMILFSASIYSQDFTVTTHGDQVTGNLNEELIYDIQVENISQEEITLRIVRVKNNIPAQWSSSLCFDLCFAPQVDSIATTSQYGSTPLHPGEKRDVSVHVFPLEIDGTGEIEILIENVNNSAHDYLVEFSVSTEVTSVEDEQIPGKFELHQNYPNPFNPSTVISFSLPESGMVTLKVYDIIGNEIAVLINSTMNAGQFNYNFNASNLPAGRHGLPSGIYFYELLTSNLRAVKKMILEK
jgi:hypothetical protein